MDGAVGKVSGEQRRSVVPEALRVSLKVRASAVMLHLWSKTVPQTCIFSCVI
jgi:hypothetical protein